MATKYKDLAKKYKGYRIILTGRELKEHAPFMGVRTPENGDWNSVEIEDYEVSDCEVGWVSLFRKEKGVYKGTVWAKVKN